MSASALFVTRPPRALTSCTMLSVTALRVRDPPFQLGRTLWGPIGRARITAVNQAGVHIRNSPENDFEWSIGDRLARSGYEVHYGVGVAGYRLVIAVRHPEYAHGYLAGIECDGATYHSARSARDRDLLRQELLERLGWKLFRVWSTDWFNDSASEFARLHSELDERLKAVRPSPKPAHG